MNFLKIKENLNYLGFIIVGREYKIYSWMEDSAKYSSLESDKYERSSYICDLKIEKVCSQLTKTKYYCRGISSSGGRTDYSVDVRDLIY